ncbi:hypothetical protein [Nocardia gipuzkoensis]
MTEELVITLGVIAGVCALFWLIFEGLPRFLECGATRPAELSRVEGFSTPAEYDCHPAPVAPFTVPQARIVMQKLIRCDADRCDCKAAAFRVLFEAGIVKPARAIR